MRTNLRGATLIEVIIVGGIFSAILSAVILIYFSTLRVERLVSVHSEIDRTMMIAVRHLDSSLKISRLEEPEQQDDPVHVDTLVLLPLKFADNGLPSVSAFGFPEWEDPVRIAYEPPELVYQDDERRVLARLGDGGHARFIRRIPGMLELDLKVEKADTDGRISSREGVFEFRLFNQ